MKRPKLSLLSATPLGAAKMSVQAGFAWPDITVEVIDGSSRLGRTASSMGAIPRWNMM